MNKPLKNKKIFLLVAGDLYFFSLGHASWKQRALYVPSAGFFNSSINELISVIPKDNMMEAARQSD